MPALDRPVHGQAVSQERLPARAEEVPRVGRLMHHRAEVFGTPPAGQDTADQALGTARTGLATPSLFRRRVRRLRASFALKLQADRKVVGQPTHHLLGPLQVKKTARHVGIGVGLMDDALIGLQDRDFRFPPVTVRLRLRRSRPDLDPTAVDGYHRHRRRGPLGVGNGVLGHEGEPRVRRGGLVALVDPLLADLPNEPLDGFGTDFQVRQLGEVAGRLLIGRAVDARMDDLLLDARAEAGVVNAQRVILRGKKPADSGDSWRVVASRRHLLAWS